MQGTVWVNTVLPSYKEQSWYKQSSYLEIVHYKSIMHGILATIMVYIKITSG